jgi:hypothetical protein
MDGDPSSECVSKEHVLEWALTWLRAKNTLEVKDLMYDLNENIEVGSWSEWIAENLCPSVNVIVPTAIDEPFWLMLIDKGAYVVVTSFKDVDGNEWIEGGA